MLEIIIGLIPFALTLFGVLGVLGFAHWLLIRRHPELNNEKKFPRQLTLLGFTLVAVVAVIFSLPISESSRNQLIGLIGIVVSGTLAFSSTTVISNLMAGVLLRMTKPFRVGDFVTLGEHFGRVTERGLFDTEIQTESRHLISIPNLFCISHPVSTIRSSGTIVSANLSLGYELDHRHVNALLLQAAQDCGLTEPFVHITELGNYAVSYRIAGFLEDTKTLLSARSNLCVHVLDSLHGEGIEIVSPSFMNQRPLKDGERMIPTAVIKSRKNETQSTAEQLAFDKAEQAEAAEKRKLLLSQHIAELEQTIKNTDNGDRKKQLMAQLDDLKAQFKAHEKTAISEDDALLPGA